MPFQYLNLSHDVVLSYQKGDLSKNPQDTGIQSQVYEFVQKRINEFHIYSWCSLLSNGMQDIL